MNTSINAIFIFYISCAYSLSFLKCTFIYVNDRYNNNNNNNI